MKFIRSVFSFSALPVPLKERTMSISRPRPALISDLISKLIGCTAVLAVASAAVAGDGTGVGNGQNGVILRGKSPKPAAAAGDGTGAGNGQGRSVRGLSNPPIPGDGTGAGNG